MVPENIHTIPTEGIGFSREEGGVNLLNFPVGRGVHQREYFQRVLVTRKRARIKETTQKFTTTMYLRRIRIIEHSKDISSVPWSDLSRENVPYGLPFSNR